MSCKMQRTSCAGYVSHPGCELHSEGRYAVHLPASLHLNLCINSSKQSGSMAWLHRSVCPPALPAGPLLYTDHLSCNDTASPLLQSSRPVAALMAAQCQMLTRAAVLKELTIHCGFVGCEGGGDCILWQQVPNRKGASTLCYEGRAKQQSAPGPCESRQNCSFEGTKDCSRLVIALFYKFSCSYELPFRSFLQVNCCVACAACKVYCATAVYVFCSLDFWVFLPSRMNMNTTLSSWSYFKVTEDHQ